MLTSSNRWLRDTTSKAIIEILKENFEFCEYLLETFADVNDPYVIQRLYGAVFGACVKRTSDSNDSYRSLVDRVYKNIFNKEIVYPDILLRDYARLIIERYIFEYPNVELNIEVDKIKPPYKSIPIPEIEDMKYSDQKLEGGEFYIQNSMRFEGIGMYGDFVSKTYTREDPVTKNLGKILNTTQDLLWEEEFDASKEESLTYSHPCAELITTLGLRQTIYDGYYYDSDGTLVAFDTALTNQKAGLVIRKSVLDKFLSEKKLHLVWFVNAAKEIHDSTLMITNYTDWSGLLVYTGDSVDGEYYTVVRR